MIERLEQRPGGNRQLALRILVMPSGSPFGKDSDRTWRALDRCGLAQGQSVMNLCPGRMGLTDDPWKAFCRAYEEEAPTIALPLLRPLHLPRIWHQLRHFMWFSETRSTSAWPRYHPVFRSGTPGSDGC